jgi:hypothetical protein
MTYGTDGTDAFGDRNKATFASAGDTCKTLLTLTTGILALTISFMSNVAKGATHNELWVLRASWLSFFLSAALGVFTLQALTGSLSPLKKPPQNGTATANPAPAIYDSNITGPAIWQNITFGVGVLLFIIFGALSVSAPKSQPTKTVCSTTSAPAHLKDSGHMALGWRTNPRGLDLICVTQS